MGNGWGSEWVNRHASIECDEWVCDRAATLQNYCEDQSQRAGGGGGGGGASGRARGKSNRAVAPPTDDSYETMLVKNMRGFSDAEIRRFVKSYKKFINPKAK